MQCLVNLRMAKQAKLIEEGLKRISTRGAVAYGRTELESAVEQGSIETLIIKQAFCAANHSGLKRLQVYVQMVAKSCKPVQIMMLEKSSWDLGAQLVC